MRHYLKPILPAILQTCSRFTNTTQPHKPAWSLIHSDFLITLSFDVVDVADAVRVLGVVVTPDLSLDKHVTAVSSKCFFQLRLPVASAAPSSMVTRR